MTERDVNHIPSCCHSPINSRSIALRSFKRPVVHGAMDCGKKKTFSVAVPPAPVRVPSQRSLAPSVASVASVANDKGDNDMILEVVHRSPGNCLTAVENPRKPQLRDGLMNGLSDQYRLKWGPFPRNEVGRTAQHVRKGEGKKE